MNPAQVQFADDVGRNNDDRTPERDNYLAKTRTHSQKELMTSVCISEVAPPLKSMVAPPLRSMVAPPLKSTRGQQSSGGQKGPG